MNAGEEFCDLARRFREIEAEVPGHGPKYVNHLAGLAARHLKQCLDAGLLSADFSGFDPPDDEDDWPTYWHLYVGTLPWQFSDRFPRTIRGLGVGDDQLRPGKPAGHIRKAIEWKEQAKDYAMVCEFLAELIEESPDDAREPKPRPKTINELIACRRKRLKELAKEHSIGNGWAELRDIANDDPRMKSLGFAGKITRETVRNDLKPRGSYKSETR